MKMIFTEAEVRQAIREFAAFHKGEDVSTSNMKMAFINTTNNQKIEAIRLDFVEIDIGEIVSSKDDIVDRIKRSPKHTSERDT